MVKDPDPETKTYSILTDSVILTLNAEALKYSISTVSDKLLYPR